MKRTAAVWVFLSAFFCVISSRADVAIGTQVIATGSEINVLEPGPNLQNVIDGITDEGPSKPYLIRLGPGLYTISPNQQTFSGLVMTPYVSIKGSGQRVTILKGAISTSNFNATSAIVTGANNATLSDLSVENSGSNMRSMAIFVGSSALYIENVTATVTGAADHNYAVSIGSGTATMTNVRAVANGTAKNNNYGVYNNTGYLTMHNVVAQAAGAASANYGLINNSGNAKVYSSTLSALGASPSGVDGVSAATRINNTLIIGGVTRDSAFTQCRNTYDEALLNVSC